MGEMLLVLPEDAKRILNDQLERVRGEIGQAEKDRTIALQQRDQAQEEVSRLEKDAERLRKAIEGLTKDETNGKAALETHRANVMRSLEARERQADARIQAAEDAEAKAEKAAAKVRQEHGLCLGAKQTLLDVAGAALKEAYESQAKVEKALTDIREA